jgi:hypothetical protein
MNDRGPLDTPYGIIGAQFGRSRRWLHSHSIRVRLLRDAERPNPTPEKRAWRPHNYG